MEALQDRFLAANTQVLGVSVDSTYCHANWAMSLGGVSFPLLADFHPKGEVAKAYGLYLDGAGITDRATVIIDADGVVRHVSSVGPGGKRDIAELAGLCEQLDQNYKTKEDQQFFVFGIDGSKFGHLRRGQLRLFNSGCALNVGIFFQSQYPS